MKNFKSLIYSLFVVAFAIASIEMKAQNLPVPSPPPPLPVPAPPALSDIAVKNFIKTYYDAYSGVPKAERLLPFYDEDVIIEDPTFDWKGEGRKAIFENFDKNNELNHYTWRVDQYITQGNMIVVEGLLQAKYGDIPYEMRFVNIFHFRYAKIIKQYDYYDNKDWYKAKEEWEQWKNINNKK